MLNVVMVVVVSLVAVLVGLVILGARRWDSETRELRARLESACVPVRPQTVDFRELQELPAPVQRVARSWLLCRYDTPAHSTWAKPSTNGKPSRRIR